MGQRKIINATIDIFNKLEVAIEAIEIGKNHYKFWVQKNGKNKLFVRASTPSDHRGGLNFTGDVKRWVRSCEKTGE